MRGRGLAFIVGRQTAKNQATQQSQSANEDDQTEQLKKLSEMHNQGALTDAEFAQAKKKVLEEK